MAKILPDIFPVTCHTDHVGPGSTFVAIRGFSHDGTSYIQKALELGATTIVVARPIDDAIRKLCGAYNATLSTVDDTRKALAELSSTAHNHAHKHLKIIGITGTKGKTTTAYLTEYLLRNAGYKTALTSTIINRILDRSEHSNHATPNSDYLHQFFAECVNADVDYVVMEVSSHALSLDRVHAIEFDAVAFTNLAHDHLDFHQTMEEYLQTKTQIFCKVKEGGSIIINTDHAWGEQALNAAFTLRPQNVSVAPLQLSSVETNTHGVACKLDHLKLYTKGLFGNFNACNMGIAAQICLQQNISPQLIVEGFEKFPGVPGRLQQHILTNGARAFVDYAHNAYSTHEVLSILRQHTNHLIVVFGCGGNKDKGRRMGMGSAAALFADHIIITNDNPRFEDPEAIIDDIISGIPEAKHSIVIRQPDRRKAIAQAASLTHHGSIIALLGKGHENYYIDQGTASYFSDFEEITKF